MAQTFFFLGKALQLLGLCTITYVVFLFFTDKGMEPLLYMSILGIVEFYLGTFFLSKTEK
jgi:hypothetical protein